MADMKRLILLLSLLGITLVNTAQTVLPHCYSIARYFVGTYICEGSYDDWVLVFEDEFNGTNLNDELWRNDFPWGRNLYCAGFPEYFSNGDNFNFNNGILELIADEEIVHEKIMDDWPDEADMFCGEEYSGENLRWFNYTSGMVFSKQAFIYGKFEIRCKIPSIKSLWPAFWLYGTTCAQEIDVFEFMSENPNPTTASKEITFTYHRKISCNDEDKVQCGDDQNTGVDMSLAMHNYSVEWNELQIIWSIDGDPVLIKPRWANSLNQLIIPCDYLYGYYIEDNIYPFDNVPMNIIASLGVRDNSTATFPVKMEIDYIRVYQKINSLSSVNICSQADINGSTVAGQEITVGGINCSSITIEDGEFLTLAAKDKITIISDFRVEEGAVFSMRIDN